MTSGAAPTCLAARNRSDPKCKWQALQPQALAIIQARLLSLQALVSILMRCAVSRPATVGDHRRRRGRASSRMRSSSGSQTKVGQQSVSILEGVAWCCSVSPVPSHQATVICAVVLLTFLVWLSFQLTVVLEIMPLVPSSGPPILLFPCVAQ